MIVSNMITNQGRSAKSMSLRFVTLFLVGNLCRVAPFSSPAQLPLPLGTAKVDYSAASEYIEEHYHIPGYFSNGSASIVRTEPIFDARGGVIMENGEIAIPLGSMKGCGFCLMDASTQVENFDDLLEVKSTYIDEMRELIPRALNIDKDEIETIVFWHPMLRGESVNPRHRSDSKPAVATAASMVHIDTDVGAYGLDGILELVGNNQIGPTSFDKDRIYELVASENRRFLFLNTWRPLVPVRSRPLAIWATRYKEPDAMFPTMRPSLDTSRWYIYPEMEPSECLIFKQYDRRRDQSCDFWHTSLDIKSTSLGEQQTLRRSFDMKALVVLKESVPSDLDRLAASATSGMSLEESRDFCNEQAKRRSKS